MQHLTPAGTKTVSPSALVIVSQQLLALPPSSPLSGALGCGGGKSVWLMLSAAGLETNPGADPGLWAFPNPTVAILSQPRLAL